MTLVLLVFFLSVVAEIHTTLEELKNCYYPNTKASVDPNRNSLCFTLNPIKSYECEVLPATVLLTLNMSAYTKPLYKIITDFSYANTTVLCIECPTTDDSERVSCKSGLKDSKYMSLSVSSETHRATVPVMDLRSQNLNLTQCYTSNSTVYIEVSKKPPDICARIEPTGSCNIIGDSGIGYYVSSFLDIYAAGNKFTYQLDPKFSVSNLLVCNAKQDIDAPTLMKSILEDEWSYGVFKLNFNLNSHSYSSETKLFKVIMSRNVECLGLTDIEVYPRHISIFVRKSSKNDASCNINDEGYSTVEPTIYVRGVQRDIKVRDSISVSYYDFGHQYRFLISCKDTSLCTEVYNNLINVSDSKELYAASYSVRFIASNGSPAAIVDGYVGSITAPCWVNSHILVYRDHFSVTLEPSGAISCPITHRLLNYTITAAVNRIQKGNPMWQEQSVILALRLKTEFSIDKTILTFQCDDETILSSKIAADNCQNTIAQLYSNRESRSIEFNFVGKDLFFNEIVNLNHTVYSIRNLDYTKANIAVISLATIVSIGYLAYVIIFYISVAKRMHVLLDAIEQRL